MQIPVVLVAVLCLYSWRTLSVKGVIMTLNSQSFLNDNMSRTGVDVFEIVISLDDFSSALRCQSELTIADVTEFTHMCVVGGGNSPINCTYDDGISLHPNGGISRGWSGNRANEGTYRVYYLRRREENPEEGYFNCFMPDDINPLSGLYILYPITGISVTFEVETGTSTFRVRCTSTGGRALKIIVSGPNGYTSDITGDMQSLGTLKFLGSDSYTARTELTSDGTSGDVYQCRITNVRTFFRSITLEAAATPTIESVRQTAPGTVRISWLSGPEPSSLSEYYTVRYSMSDGAESVSDSVNSTSIDVSGLTDGRTYNFRVEAAASNILPAVSDHVTFTLGPDPPDGVVAMSEPSSVTVSWGAVDNANRYIVTLSQAQETNQQGLCPNESHTLTIEVPSTTVSISVVGGVQSYSLRAYTTYEVTIVSVGDVLGTSSPSETRRVLTSQTSAEEAPGDVRAEAQSSSEISVQWSGLSDCRLINGRIAGYRVLYENCCTGGTIDYTIGDGQGWMSGGEVTLTGLTPYTNYSISVAAVNENGDVGLQSEQYRTMTHPFSCRCDSEGEGEGLFSSTGVVVGVVAGLLIGVGLGVSGLIGGALIAKRYRPETKREGKCVATEANPAYSVYHQPEPERTVHTATEIKENPAYGVNINRHRETERVAQFDDRVPRDEEIVIYY